MTYDTFMELARSLDIEPCSEAAFVTGQANRDAKPFPTAVVVGAGRVSIERK